MAEKEFNGDEWARQLLSLPRRVGVAGVSLCVVAPISSLSPSRLQNNYCVPSELSSAALSTAQLCSAAFTPWQCSPLPAVAQPNLAARKLPRSQPPGRQNRWSDVKLNFSPMRICTIQYQVQSEKCRCQADSLYNQQSAKFLACSLSAFSLTGVQSSYKYKIGNSLQN